MIDKIKRKIYKLFHPIQGEIWCLHRVVPLRSEIQRNRELEITPEYLENLIVEYRSKNFEFLSLQDIYDQKLFKFRFPWQKKFVNVSFDDGFVDNYTFAFPILKKHNVPFTLYLTTDFPNKKVIIWWILLENILLDNLEIHLSTGEKFNCESIELKKEVYELLIKRIYSSEDNTSAIFSTLFSNYIVSCQHQNEALSLNWEQLKEMCADGLCTIGSHSVSHPSLIKLSPSNLKAELEDSREIIQNRLNREVNHFSYPHSFWNKQVEAAVKTANYLTATMGYGGEIRYRDNKLKLNRKYIVQK